MKGSKRDSQKFRWKFTKSMLRRPLEKSPALVMVHQEKWQWHGTILAILTIALISGVIVLAALFFTSWGSKIHYQHFTVGELLWVSRRYKDPAYFWHKDLFIVATPNGSWYQMNISGTIPATFAESLKSAQTISLNTKEFEPVSGLWPNSEKSAWLIEHQRTSIRTQEKCFRYTVILLKSGLRIEVKLTEGHRTEEQLHFARWTDQAEFSLLVQSGSHLYFTRSIVDRSSSGFQCLTCRLPKGWTYAYPGWIYRYYFGYGQVGAFWKSGNSDILVLATNEDHLKTLPIVRYQTSVGDFSTDVEAAVHTPYRPLSKPLRVPKIKIILMDFSGKLKISFNWTLLSTLVAQIPNESNTSNETINFVLAHVEWFNETNFLLFGVFDTERCGFILLCSVLQEQIEKRCQHVWYQCIWKGSLNMVSGKLHLY
ncbi:unnamed protein product [Dicrocoelium dendriticum]|nr:unnamed protein product [Dicrocoelium dendriticum]CAI2737356.1 unnamed protein product [Dicrocoelium dendriticum]